MRNKLTTNYDLPADYIYNALAKACIDATEETIPRKTKAKNDALWEKAKVTLVQEQFKLAQETFQENPNEGNEQCLNNHPVNLYATYDQEKQNMISKRIIEIEEGNIQNKSRLAWETVREISGIKSSQSIKVIGETPQDQLQNWRTHFKELIGKPALPSEDQTHTIISKQLPIKMDDFTLAELLASIKSKSNHKSCGLDESC